MVFIRLDEHLTVNTHYITKVKWKLNSDTNELTASVFLSGSEKNEVVAVRGDTAYELWDILHDKEELPQVKLHQSGDTLPSAARRQLRKKW